MTSGCISYARQCWIFLWNSVWTEQHCYNAREGYCVQAVPRLFKYSQRIVSDLIRCVFLTVSSLCPSQCRHIAMVLYVSLCYPPLQGDQFLTDTQTWQYEQWVISLSLWFNLSHWFHLRCHLENKMTMDYSTFLINSNNRFFTCRIGKRPLHMVQHMILYFLFSVKPSTLFA